MLNTMRDFTINTYRTLLESLQAAGYAFLTATDYYRSNKELLPERFVIIRHDVDTLPENSALTARLEHTLGVKATYYFRIVKESNSPVIIKQIAALEHEIGYHYEDLTTANGDIEKAYQSFCNNLAYFKQFYEVSTICMHGSPRSKYDSKDIWKAHDYHKLGIVAEPYLDSDFSRLFYLTDTGRCWDGFNVSVRDKIEHYQDLWTSQGLVYHTTFDILYAINSGTLPKQLMITTHPQRWTDNRLLWLKELCMQSLKNIVKRIIIISR